MEVRVNSCVRICLIEEDVYTPQSKAKESTGLATVLGFALAAGLSLAS